MSATRKKLTPTQRRIIWTKVDDAVLTAGNSSSFPRCKPTTLCRSCNWYKSTFSVETFRQQIAAIPARLRKNPAFRIAERYGLIEIHEKPIAFRMDTHKEPF